MDGPTRPLLLPVALLAELLTSLKRNPLLAVLPAVQPISLLRHLLLAVPPVEQPTSLPRHLLLVALPAVQPISQKRSPLPAALLVELATSNSVRKLIA